MLYSTLQNLPPSACHKSEEQLPPHRLLILISCVSSPYAQQHLYNSSTGRPSPSLPPSHLLDLLPPLKSPPCANSDLSLAPGISPRKNLIFNISLSVAGNTRPSLSLDFHIQPSRHLSISIHSLEFGVRRGYFYCIKISQYSSKFPSSLLSFPFCFSGCISPLHIDHFFNPPTFPLLPLPPLISIIDGRVILIEIKKNIEFKYSYRRLRSDGKLEVRNGVTVIGFYKRHDCSTKIMLPSHCPLPPEAKSGKLRALPTLSTPGKPTYDITNPLNPEKKNTYPTILTLQSRSKKKELPTAPKNRIHGTRYTLPTSPMTSESNTERSKPTSEEPFPPTVQTRSQFAQHLKRTPLNRGFPPSLLSTTCMNTPRTPPSHTSVETQRRFFMCWRGERR